MAKSLTYMNKKITKYEETYFKGDKSTYTRSYEYKAGNIATVYQERAVDVLKRYTTSKAKVLDVACAFGDLLSLLDSDTYATYGIDISNYALARAKKNTKAHLIQGDLNKKLPYQNNFFDVIFALDIIEHVESPHLFLLELERILKKRGILFIQTPNINSIFERFAKEKWFGYQDDTHLHLFTRKSLQFLLKQSEFSILTNQTFAAPFPKVIRTLIKNTDIGGNLWVVAQKK
ncbi:hypothetical protein BH11PAT1_BH11PAT1_2480 [soil metagenome]